MAQQSDIFVIIIIEVLKITSSGTPQTLHQGSWSHKIDWLRFNGHFSAKPGLAGFIRAKDDGSGGDNWSYKTCKAPVRSSANKPATNFFTGCHPTNFDHTKLLLLNKFRVKYTVLAEIILILLLIIIILNSSCCVVKFPVESGVWDQLLATQMFYCD